MMNASSNSFRSPASNTTSSGTQIVAAETESVAARIRDCLLAGEELSNGTVVERYGTARRSGVLVQAMRLLIREGYVFEFVDRRVKDKGRPERFYHLVFDDKGEPRRLARPQPPRPQPSQPARPRPPRPVASLRSNTGQPLGIGAALVSPELESPPAAPPVPSVGTNLLVHGVFLDLATHSEVTLSLYDSTSGRVWTASIRGVTEGK